MSGVVRYDPAESKSSAQAPPGATPILLSAPVVARMEPTGPAFGGPDDRLHEIRGEPFFQPRGLAPDCGTAKRSLHPGYDGRDGGRQLIRGRARARVIAKNTKECGQELQLLTAYCSQARVNWLFPPLCSQNPHIFRAFCYMGHGQTPAESIMCRRVSPKIGVVRHKRRLRWQRQPHRQPLH